MVEVRVENKEIDFRIAYLGRTGATKFANIRRLHDALRPLGAGDLTVIHAGGDRIVGFHLVDEEESRLFEMRVGFKLVTIPGEIRSRANELLLASSADAVVWIDDRVGEDEGAPHALAEVLGAIADQGVGEAARPVMVQCYSDDGEDRATRYRRSLEGREARIRRIDSDEEGVRGLFEEVKKHVLDTYRELERGQPGAGSQGPDLSALPSGRRVVRRRDSAIGRALSRVNELRRRRAGRRLASRKAELAFLGAVVALGLAAFALLFSMTL